ncbi:hypothetical protein N8T08_010825 [Aspergillus melleus]|uniref:Uncharacterized protein n=1 Tax=Aspergillus melleus TaxID=138277 RepID=A0ACC3BBU5_9EURO|nr:hypothetical protein N8T08_010825 [Aspergillus melleus]
MRSKPARHAGQPNRDVALNSLLVNGVSEGTDLVSTEMHCDGALGHRCCRSRHPHPPAPRLTAAVTFLFQGPGVPGHQQRALAFASPVSPWDLLPITTASITDLQYLSPYFATRCFDIFASSFWHLNPFCPINLLHVALCDLLGVVGSPNISSSVDRANVLAVLAIGASCTERFPLADYLHRKSRQYAEQEEGNKLSVLQHQLLQISFPKPSFHPVSDCSQLTRQQHAQYHLNMNQHGFAYTILTNARRGHLIGRQSTEFGSGRTSTVVTLNAFAQLLSLCVGCLPDYPDENGMIPSNDQLPPALSGINQFARIASQIGQIQQKWGRHPETLAHASFELYRPLQLALLDVSNRCRLLYAQDPQQRVEVEVLICVMLHYVIQILFRPFLMMKLLYLYRVQLQFPDETSSPQWFDLAGAYTVRAARAIIGLIGQAFDFGSVVKDLPGNGFFLESACVSLILMCLCDGPREAYLGDIWLGMYHMSRMSCQALVKERIQSLMGLLAITGLAGVRNYQV